MSPLVFLFVISLIGSSKALKCHCLPTGHVPQNCTKEATCNAGEGFGCTVSHFFYHGTSAGEWERHCQAEAPKSEEPICSEKNVTGYLVRSCTCFTDLCNVMPMNAFLEDQTFTTTTTTTTTIGTPTTTKSTGRAEILRILVSIVLVFGLVTLKIYQILNMEITCACVEERRIFSPEEEESLLCRNELPSPLSEDSPIPEEQLEDLLEEAQAECDDLQERCDELEDYVIELQNQKQQLEDSVTSLKHNIAHVAAEKTILRTMHTRSKRRNAILQLEIKHLKSDAKEMKEKNEQTREDLERENMELRKVIQEWELWASQNSSKSASDSSEDPDESGEDEDIIVEKVVRKRRMEPSDTVPGKRSRY
ncbi:hypothetical protein QR680_018998 [Steinernema hermaphroditum]|uniref:Activin types I and II receptor domain-containing protein n=1 Tax=Steinernema hermaphroditum TaxID=289476 RepID=A0AA39LR73_9BILA|nr:hypothetical protein QR680_018998 [Steinernema hermaphroditum]